MNDRFMSEPKRPLLRMACQIAAVLITGAAAHGANYYVAPGGSDANPGTAEAPFATVMRAQAAANAGDVVYLRGGTYSTFTIAAVDSNYNYVHRLNKGGVSWTAYPGETPVFDFSSVPTNLRVCGFHVTGTGIKITGLEVTGVKDGMQKQSECFRIDGSAASCDFYDCVAHDNAANGFYFTNKSKGSCTRCDAYNNVGTNGASVGNTDGFGAHGTGVTFRYCRSWHNSDDGYDCINSPGANIFDHCWAYDMRVGGDSNGFKIGGFGIDPSTVLPKPVPVHTVRYCLAAYNDAHGFYANHHPGQAATWTNNTGYNNGSGNFCMLERTSDMKADVAGYREVLHGNLGYGGIVLRDDATPVENAADNSWTRPDVVVTDDDFLSLEAKELTIPRGTGNNMPQVRFMHLRAGSPLVGLGCFASAPAAPAQVSASPSPSGVIDVAWSQADGATEYYVERASTASGPFVTVAARLSGTSFTDTSVRAGENYVYRVVAMNSVAYDAGTSISVSVTAAREVGAARILQINDNHWSGLVDFISTKEPREDAAIAKLINLSVRGKVTAGEPLIAGATIVGQGQMPVLVREVGPTLSAFGISNPLLVPLLRVYAGNQVVVESNDISGLLSPALSYVGAFPSQPTAGYRDAACNGLGGAGVVTVHGTTIGAPGIALVEFYDGSSRSTTDAARFSNLSARGQLDAGDGLLTVGFIITGPGQMNLLLRGVGPSLTQFGVQSTIRDPKIELYAGRTKLVENDDWQSATGGDVASATQLVGAFSLADKREAVLIARLGPGTYTLLLRDKFGQLGTGLAEIYEIR